MTLSSTHTIPIHLTEADGSPMVGRIAVKPEVLEAIHLAETLLHEAGITAITIRNDMRIDGSDETRDTIQFNPREVDAMSDKQFDVYREALQRIMRHLHIDGVVPTNVSCVSIRVSNRAVTTEI
ncbi:MAG: hypothetical protein K2X09_06000 [Rickettsiales bacterium]|nr:hypothetical protein [Rickettsiales bacterium]